MQWKGIEAIREEAQKHLIPTNEENWIFFSAPEGYKLIMSGVAIAPPTWKREIKDFGIKADGGGRKDRIFIRGFDEGSGQIITEDEEPLLELIQNQLPKAQNPNLNEGAQP